MILDKLSDMPVSAIYLQEYAMKLQDKLPIKEGCVKLFHQFSHFILKKSIIFVTSDLVVVCKYLFLLFILAISESSRPNEFNIL